MAEMIRVMIVDDLSTTRESVSKLLQFEANVELIAEASTGTEAIQKAHELKPDIILMDINMPDMDGITASKRITTEVTGTQIIMMSVQSETDYMRRAMLAGARDFLTKPFSLDELLTAVHNAYERRKIEMAKAPPSRLAGAPVGSTPAARAPVDAVTGGNVVAVYSPKGGVGCSTVAVNLAVSLAKSGQSVALMDGNLQFGDVAVMLNLKPMASIIDLVERSDELDLELLSSVVTTHQSGLQILPSPPRPEMAEMVRVEHIEKILNEMRQQYGVVFVDTGSKLDDITLAILDKSDRVLLIMQQDLPGIRNASRFLDLANDLDYPPEKIALTINGLVEKGGIATKDISKVLKRPVYALLPYDSLLSRQAMNRGEPIVFGQGRKKPLGNSLLQMAARLSQELDGRSEGQPADSVDKKKKKSGRGFFSRLFGR